MRIAWRTDRPPKEEEEYLTTLNNGRICVCRWTDRDMFDGRPGTDEWRWQPPQYTWVVAWMPLPEPYKIEDCRESDTE